MEYPFTYKSSRDFEIKLYSGLTIFVGPNGSGKTRTLKEMRDHFKSKRKKVRYLSSNRLGEMEQYRSITNQFSYSIESYSVGDLNKKKVRDKIETISGDFFAMDEKRDVYIKVAERLSTMFGRQIYLKWDNGNLKIFFEKKDDLKEYSVVLEASGLVNIVSILAALYDDDMEILLIDEPEVSLHPQLQAYLLKEIKKIIKLYNKTIIISTHSSEFLSFSNAKEFCNLVFFDENKNPIQLHPDMDELKNKNLKEFLFRMSQMYKNGFFAKNIFLLEGTSDLIVCQFLINKFYLEVEAAGTQIIPVDGKGQFPIITKLFRLLNKKVTILTDLDSYTDDNTLVNFFSNFPEATDLAVKSGAGSIIDIDRNIREKISELIKNNRDKMENIYAKHPYWNSKEKEGNEEKYLKRAIIGELFIRENIDDWPSAKEWKFLKERMIAIFDMLKKLGCFILKKGALESYYMYSSKNTYERKPSVAIEEISELETKEKEEILKNYKDIVEALEYIALLKNIDESLAIRNELLSEIAIILQVLDEDTTENDIVAAVKKVKGHTSSLFKYNILNEGGKLGIEVELKSKILEVIGFPFKIYKGDNVNNKIEENIKNRN